MDPLRTGLAVALLAALTTAIVFALRIVPLADTLVATRSEIEGWLALGATLREAAAPTIRHAAAVALMPATDQTRVAKT